LVGKVQYVPQLVKARSAYIASTAFGPTPYFEGPEQNPNNKYPAMIVYDWLGRPETDDHNGGNAVVIRNSLLDAGHFALLCGEFFQAVSAKDQIVQFLFDHPWGTRPSPYESALPTEFQATCPPKWLPRFESASSIAQ
jgi:hypothetical protein